MSCMHACAASVAAAARGSRLVSLAAAPSLRTSLLLLRILLLLILLILLLILLLLLLTTTATREPLLRLSPHEADQLHRPARPQLRSVSHSLTQSAPWISLPPVLKQQTGCQHDDDMRQLAPHMFAATTTLLRYVVAVHSTMYRWRRSAVPGCSHARIAKNSKAACLGGFAASLL
eukprot:GHVU01194523.1.p2 GENE.GHVU01194523.1~~GHVU01194523.1.p2  ORF type:complete len:175 (-),score=16.74 GHVU01194523.1:224-748(-)